MKFFRDHFWPGELVSLNLTIGILHLGGITHQLKMADL